MIDVLILGAGMAGLSAAHRLKKTGLSFLILEARPRLGGRTHTDSSLGPHVDMGASWLHGPTGNPLKPLVDKLNIAHELADFTNEQGGSVMAYEKGHGWLHEKAYAQGLQAYYGDMARLSASPLEKPPVEARSLADLYQAGYPKKQLFEDDHYAARLKGYLYSSLIRVQESDAAPLEEIDWRDDSYHKLPGGDALLYGGGYRAILNDLARDLVEGEDYWLESPISQIDYGTDGVRVTAARGVVKAKTLICTLPLGVLKSSQVTFNPALPPEKAAAIERLGVGDYEKLVLKFPDIFWPRQPKRLHYLDPKGPHILASWLNVAHFTGDAVLLAYAGGSRAKAMNQLADETLLNLAQELLAEMFGEIPAPLSYLRSNWSKDPYSQGSYSFPQVGQRPEDRAMLARNFGPLFFAGEATHSHFYGTAHGAYETGILAALEILNFLKR
ncbi:MAG: FAD-dependent oxidoreductase [Deinococcales bacterium]